MGDRGIGECPEEVVRDGDAMARQDGHNLMFDVAEKRNVCDGRLTALWEKGGRVKGPLASHFIVLATLAKHERASFVRRWEDDHQRTELKLASWSVDVRFEEGGSPCHTNIIDQRRAAFGFRTEIYGLICAYYMENSPGDCS